MKIKDVMTTGVECVRPETTLQEAAAKMKSLNVGPLPVCEGDRAVGIVTDRDIVIRAISDGRDPRTTPVRDVMTKDVVTVQETDDADHDAAIIGEPALLSACHVGQPFSLGIVTAKGGEEMALAVVQRRRDE